MLLRTVLHQVTSGIISSKMEMEMEIVAKWDITAFFISQQTINHSQKSHVSQRIMPYVMWFEKIYSVRRMFIRNSWAKQGYEIHF